MYNKLFTSILDSSIWLEDPPTKVVWITLLAAMNEDGFAHFSAIKNLSNRAVLSLEDTAAAVKVLESEDSNSADKEFDGRRIERVPGGWIVLNANKYHDLTTRADAKDKVRERVRRHRQRKSGNACNVTCNALSLHETKCNPSETDVHSDSKTQSEKETVHDTNFPIPEGYSESSKAVIAIWHEVACGAALNFLPIDQFSQAVEDVTVGFGNPNEARELFEWCVARERERPSLRRKTLVRVLQDVTIGEGFFTDYPYRKKSELEDDEIPF